MSGDTEAAALMAKEDPPVTTTRVAADVELGDSPGIYQAVIVAAFGGVGVTLKKDGTTFQLHPMFVLLLALPVFVTQVSSILILRAGLDTSATIYTPEDGHSVALLKLKLVLIVIVYLSNFKVLLYSLTYAVFVANPISWTELKHYRLEQGVLGTCLPNSAKVLTMPTIAPCAALAVFMLFTSSYMVCIDSVSIILAAGSAQDAIFNSLAISFVTDLKGVWWEFCSNTFRLTDITEFKFAKLPDNEVWSPDGTLHPQRLEHLPFPFLFKMLVRATTWTCCKMRTSFLRVGFGSMRVQQLFSLILLMAVYSRQLLVVIFAIDTNVLPAARDLCEEIKLEAGGGKTWASWGLKKLDSVLLVDMNVEVNFAAQHDSLRSRCFSGELERMKMPKIRSLVSEHWHEILGFTGLMVGLLVLPSLAIALYGIYSPQSKVDEIQNEEIEDLQTTVKILKSRLSELEGRTESKVGSDMSAVKADIANLREEFASWKVKTQ
mmetsp:Transcript_115899/g.334709  ORF Transcript_115899/g.334709 Transcript_115899/m.334709 type:complete len:491 (+) Transcript_115899:70-1542(+)